MYDVLKWIPTLDFLSQLRGVIERTGSKSRSIPFSNPAAAARALPACHKWPTNRKNPKTK